MKIAIIGAGSWGTTLASLLSEIVDEVVLWARRKEIAEEINAYRSNSTYLPGVRLPEKIIATDSLKIAISNADLVIMAVPSKHFREVCNSMVPYVDRNTNFLSVTKGIEADSLLRMSEIISEVFGVSNSSIAVLSGPNHAEEVIKRIPTATVVASENMKLAEELQKILMRDYFRVYTHNDVVGVELAGTMKNVIAIAVGISDGLGYGDNTRATLITRGLAEMVRLGKKMGANPLTFLGLSGIGDLIATATSRHSRNRNFGEEVGKGRKIEEILSSTKMFVEGVVNARSVLQLSEKYGVEMPIVGEVYRIIYERKSPRESVNSLMLRAPKPEIELI
ncbi:MAG: NAD(P)H-dependent glycerol-3-phosphate dehydrogenase [Actinobacteria bacterium]|nr:NAD(P)H-dependent glycerol-3-phosphate dehydrogenase [Actinomycetota bacterium]